MGDYGFKVSQDGYDVLTATNKQLGLSSAFNHFKISAEGSGVFNGVASMGSASSNNLATSGYVGFLAYVKNELGEWNYLNPQGNDEISEIWGYSSINNGTLQIQVFNNTGTVQNISYKYFTFVEQG